MNKLRTAAALLLALGTSAASPRGETVLVTGHYRISWEEQSFTPCEGVERWWVSDPGPLMKRYREVVPDRNWGTVYATVRVELTDRGMYGHLGAYPRAAAVREVREARAPRQDDCRERVTEAR